MDRTLTPKSPKQARVSCKSRLAKVGDRVHCVVTTLVDDFIVAPEETCTVETVDQDGDFLIRLPNGHVALAFCYAKDFYYAEEAETMYTSLLLTPQPSPAAPTEAPPPLDLQTPTVSHIGLGPVSEHFTATIEEAKSQTDSSVKKEKVDTAELEKANDALEAAPKASLPGWAEEHGPLADCIDIAYQEMQAHRHCAWLFVRLYWYVTVFPCLFLACLGTIIAGAVPKDAIGGEAVKDYTLCAVFFFDWHAYGDRCILAMAGESREAQSSCTSVPYSAR
jgi:hypothetical protein